jgi:hypothetical protein
MTADFLTKLNAEYRAYVDTFRENGVLPQMMQLKLEHTGFVVENAKLIMAGEGWPETDSPIGEACALLHDTGRYAQLKEFGTFRDSVSVDHAEKSVEIIQKQGWLDSLPADERDAVIAAVKWHNKRDVPADLPPFTTRLAHLVRDADKLDIFRVLEEAVNGGALKEHPEIAWGLPVYEDPSDRVVASVRAGKPVEYSWIKTLADFVMIQVGWLNGGLHYLTAMRLAQKRHALEFRRAFLKRLSDSPVIDQTCDEVRDRIAARLG